MKKKSLLNLIRMIGGLVIVVSGLLLLGMDIAASYHDFQVQSERMRKRLEDEQKNVVKQEVLQARSFVCERLANAENDGKNRVAERTGEGYAIAWHIYNKNKGKKSDAEIQAMILDALRPVRFFQGTGYYFITRFDGVEILFADRPQLEGKNLMSLRDPDGKEVIRDMIAIASKRGEGFYRYRWTKPDKTENNFEKVAFVKRFEPYDWLIGSGLYLDDVDAQIRKNILDRLSYVRFGREGYLFVNRYNGDALVSSGKLFSGKNKLWEEFPEQRDALEKIFQLEMDAAKKPDGAFIAYSFRQLNSKKVSRKVSFVKGLPRFGWLIGAGFYTDEIEESVRAMTVGLKAEMWKRIGRSAAVIVLSIVVFLIVIGLIERKVGDRLKTFFQFFARAAKSDELFDRSHIQFDELDQIAEHVNRMLTEKRAAKNGLIEEKEKLSVTLQSIGDAVISTDRSGSVELMNSVAENLTGWNTGEAKGKQLAEVFAIENAKTGEKAENPVANVLEHGNIVGLANHTRLISKGGAEYQIADSAAPIRDAEGNITGVVLVFRDVTEQYRKDDQLRRSEENLRAIFDAAKNVAFIITDVDVKSGKILEFSPGAETIFGYSLQEAIGMPAAVLHLAQDVEKFPAVREEMATNRPGFNGESILVRKSGETFPALFTTYPVLAEDGAMVAVIGVAIDISKQKEAEEEIRKLEKLRSIGTLAGGLAHDFNNIMMGLFGNISLAKMKLADDAPARVFIEKAEKSLERATGLTNQLLTFAKGGVPVREEVSLPELVKQTVEFDLSGSPVKAVFETAPELWKVNVDRRQMHQVFSNLAINARQAMPEGGMLTVLMKNSGLSPGEKEGLPAGRYIKITVKDQGCGIEEQNLDKIFDPYFTTKHDGRGLGLATTYSIISKHDGLIDVDSEVGRGTTFTVYLPAAESGGQTSALEGKKEVENGKGSKQMHVMIMDDEEMVRDVVGEMLEISGFEVERAADGAVALELYRKAMETGSRFDGVIMDITIPGGMGGKEAVRKLLDMDPDAKAIVSSGYADDPIMAAYKEYGFSGAIAKPFRLDALKNELVRVLGIEKHI